VLQTVATLRPPVHGNARGLVDDQHQPVAVEQSASYVFRRHAETRITAPGMSDSTNEDGASPGWFGRLTGGLQRTSSQLRARLVAVVPRGPLDPAKLDSIQDRLVRADLGYDLAHRVTTIISQGMYSQGITPDQVKAIVAGEVAKILKPVAKPLVIGGAKPFV